MLMGKSFREMSSLLRAGKGVVSHAPHFGPEKLLLSQFCGSPTVPPILGAIKPKSKSIPVSCFCLMSTGSSNLNKKKGKRIKISEQGKVYGNLRLNSLFTITQHYMVKTPSIYLTTDTIPEIRKICMTFITIQVKSWTRKKRLGRSTVKCLWRQ